MDNFVGRCIDCAYYLDCDYIDDLKAELTIKHYNMVVRDPLPCPDYEFAGEANV